MLNVVAIMGRLARDPEMRQTTTGKNVASFRIACDRGRRDANGRAASGGLDRCGCMAIGRPSLSAAISRKVP